MTRYLLAAATVAGALFTATPAGACELQYCWYTKPVCDALPPDSNCSDITPIIGCHELGNLPEFCIEDPRG